MGIAQFCGSVAIKRQNVWIVYKNGRDKLYTKRKRMVENKNDLKFECKQRNIIAESMRKFVAQHWKLLTSFPYRRPDGSAPVGAKTLWWSECFCFAVMLCKTYCVIRESRQITTVKLCNYDGWRINSFNVIIAERLLKYCTFFQKGYPFSCSHRRWEQNEFLAITANSCECI